MQRAEMLQLDAVAARSLAELHATNADLATSLQTAASDTARALITDRLETASDRLRAAVEDVGFGLRESGTLADELVTRLEDAGVGSDLIEEARTAAAALTPDADAQTLLRPDEPIMDNPVFGRLLEEARVHRLAAIADVPESRTTAILARGVTAERLDDPMIETLIGEGALSSDQARHLGFVTSLYRLLDGDPALTAALVTPLDELPDGRFGAVRRLATVSEERWEELIEEADESPPDRSTAAEYARRIRRRVEAAFPTDAVVARIEAHDLPALEADLAAAAPALAAGALLVGNEPPDLSMLPEADRPAVEAGFASVRAAVNAMPGLGLEALLADGAMPAAERLAAAQTRVDALLALVDANPQVELLGLDLSSSSPDLERLRLDMVDEADRPRVLATLKAYQRTYALTNDVGTAAALLTAGYDSASRIVAAGEPMFTARAGLDYATVRRTYDAALASVATAGHTVGSILEATDGAQPIAVLTTLDASVAAHFRRIDGYEDLFGQQDYCACEHCSSLLSPAAYFVDLMRYIERSLTAPAFGTNIAHPLHLRNRRPDLWRLELTCENTETEVPVLDIVNEILERDIAARSGFVGDPADAAAIRQLVYGQVLASADDSFAQPFNLALARLRIYLVNSGRTRGEIASLVSADADVLAAATLGLSSRERAVIATSNVDLARLSSLYAIPFTLVSGSNLVTPFDAQDLLRALGVPRETMDALMASRIASSPGAMRVEGERRDGSSVQNDIERVHEARTASLDLLHRLTRLHRAFAALENGPAWSIPELDLVLAELGPGLDGAALRRLATVVRLGRRLGVDAEELVALVAGLPTMTLDPARPSLFDRRFNLPDFVLLDGRLPRDATRYVLPSLRDNPAANVPDYVLPRLLGGLRVSADTLERLVRGLAGPLGIPAAALSQPPGLRENARGFALSRANLSLLYRHARLGQLLGLDAASLLLSIRLAPGIAGDAVSGLDDIQALIDFHDRLAAGPYDLSDVADLAMAATVPAFSTRVAERIKRDGVLVFTDTLLAFLDGVTEDDSRAVLAANPGVTQSAGSGRLRVANALDTATPITVPSGVSVTAEAIRSVLLARHPQTVIPTALAGELGFDTLKMAALVSLTGQDLRAPALFAELLGAGATPRLDELCRLLAAPARALRAAAFDADTVRFIITNRAAFGLAAIDPPGVDAAELLATYHRFADGGRFGPQLRAALGSGYAQATGFPAAARPAVAVVLDCEPSLVAALQASIALPANPLQALARLAGCVEAAQQLGVDGRALARISSEQYAELDQAANAVLAGFRARYADEAEWEQVIQPFEAQLRNRRRDALAEWLVRSAGAGYRNRADLYRQYLIDVEADGILTTSRLVSAIGSLQLYVQRVRMDLEQAADGSVRVPPSLVRDAEWSWRKHYRVWEACRTIFLRCENFLLPDLRDDKTPLFGDLADGLLQSELDEQAVLDAYTTYARGFREVASLQVAGACHDYNDAALHDELHLIGVTPGDPPRFYHRIVEGSRLAERIWGHGVVYHPWRQVDVNIPVRDVAPVIHDGRLHLFWVEITSSPQNELTSSGSRFVGYRHKCAVKCAGLQVDGRWTPPQRIDLSDTTTYGQAPFYATDGIIDDPLIEPADAEAFATAVGQLLLFGVFTEPNIEQRLQDLSAQLLFIPRYDTKPHLKPLDGYTLRGAEFTRIYPQSRGGRIGLRGIMWRLRAEVDLLDRIAVARPIALDTGAGTRVPSPVLMRQTWDLYATTPPASYATPDEYAFVSRVQEWQRFWVPWVDWVRVSDFKQDKIAEIEANAVLIAINGSPSDGIVNGPDGDVYLLQLARFDSFALRRLSTTTGRDIERGIASSGVNGFLALSAQQALSERAVTFHPVWRIDSRLAGHGLDYRGAMGTYFRELFLHIPLLVADTLNSQQRYDEAQRWYEHIFDPTAEDSRPGPYVGIATARGDLGIDVHLVGLTQDGGIEHTLRGMDGTWLGERIDVKRASGDPGEVREIACAGGLDALHVCASLLNGALVHTLRRFDGTWQRSFGDVKAAVGSDPGRILGVACAVDNVGALHVCVTTVAGGVFHAVRNNDGSWRPGWTDVLALTSNPGPARWLACATDQQLRLHVCINTRDGGLWHGFRNFDGSWSGPLGNVKAVTSDPGEIVEAACAVDRGNTLHVCALTADRGVWHTLRRPDGTWQPFFGDVRAAAGSPGLFWRIACTRPAEDDTLEVLGSVDGVPWVAVRETNSWRIFERTGFNARDRSWRYNEFRGLSSASLRRDLTDTQAIEAYKRDPFSPHAVARLRLTAYQKAVVMRYVTNLLDKADALFARYEQETLNEAAILYATAADVLGERPAALGACGEGVVTPRTYETLSPFLDLGTEFLTEIEHWSGPASPGGGIDGRRALPSYVLDEAIAAGAISQAEATLVPATGAVRSVAARARSGRALLGATEEVAITAATVPVDGEATIDGHLVEAVVRQVGPAFCVPPNPALLALWDRLEDRWSKLRHGLDITGERRRLTLFAPQLDPMALIRGAAAGLSADDLLDTQGGELPPYRFDFLIAKAKEQAATVQALGSALLLALERKDVETLADLRTVHEDRLLALQRDVRQWEYDAAAASVEALNRRRATVQQRRDHYQSLVDGGLIAEEWTQRISQHLVSGTRVVESTLDLLAGTTHLLPDVGSPFAMKYGGTQLGKSLAGFAGATRAIGDVAGAITASAAMEGGFNRRSEDWRQQVALAQGELDEIDQQITAATRQRDIATRAITVHQRTIEQTREIYDFARERFTRVGLYIWQSTQLQRLHREAFNAALAVARMAERALRYERDDPAPPQLSAAYWDAGRAGLLAGVRLGNDLQAMERRFLETDEGGLEIDQSFSLAQIEPAALVALRQTGTCNFTLPELFFDLPYPGGYRRRIKAVRVTIPAVTGEYTNVGATLTLTASRIRRDPRLGAAALRDVPLPRITAVALSFAQRDAGVWELDFYGQRYQPFERAGAVESAWTLTLPTAFPQFPYDLIRDVVLRVSYTALYDGGLRNRVETSAQGIIGALAARPFRRVFSLRYEFPDVFNRLVSSPSGTTVPLTLTRTQLPFFLETRTLALDAAQLAMVPRDGQVVDGLTVSFAGDALTGFAPSARLSRLPAVDANAVLDPGLLGSYELAITDAGALAPDGPAVPGGRAIDEEKLLDILLYAELTAS